jgi:hypothetical protein
METETQEQINLLKESADIKELISSTRKYRKSVLLFIKDMWSLTPQVAKPEYQARWQNVINASPEEFTILRRSVTARWFGDPVDPLKPGGEWNWYGFTKYVNLTWQQTLIALAAEKAIQPGSFLSRRISVRSGHGIGKSSISAILILWFLRCFFLSKVPVTAPTSAQMNDVLWNELSLWITRMPPEIQAFYEWKSDYIRVSYAPASWFARARTASKDNVDAIAGVHADDVFILADEASGVFEQVFSTAEGALTSSNVLFIMISNPTQLIGYFYDSHHKNAEDYQLFAFNSEESPIVDRKFIALKAKHGVTSDEYKIRVKGSFPGEGAMDNKGYMQLIAPNRITITDTNHEMFLLGGRNILGIDPAGEGKDKATFVIRNSFRMEKVHEMLTSNAKQIAEVALTLMDKFHVVPDDVVVDNFGVGADVGKYIALGSKGKFNVYTVYVGNPPAKEQEINGQFFRRQTEELIDTSTQKDLYLNIRALMYFRLQKWIMKGGAVGDSSVDNGEFKNELVVVKYKRSLQGNTIQLQPKTEMAKEGIKSPNIADAGALTMLRDLDDVYVESDEAKAQRQAEEADFDPHSII